MIPWILIAIGTLAVLLAAVGVMVARKEKQPREPDYRAWFIMGCVFIAFYIVSLFITDYEPALAFLTMGVVFAAMGLAKVKRWGKPRRLLNKKEIRNRKITMMVLGILVILGVVVLILFSESVM